MTDQEQKNIFGRNLTYFVSRRRRETGQTQKDIAIAMGFSPTTFNTWCTGGAMPSVGKIQKIADFFGVGKSDLVDDKGDPNEFYLDDESREMAEFLKNNKDYRVLFDAMRNVRPSDIQKVKDFIDEQNGNT